MRIEKPKISSFLARYPVKATILLILTGFFYLPATVDGQSSSAFSTGNERLFIHLEKFVYVTGEAIKYKVYLLNGTSQEMAPCSKILYFTLAEVNGNSLTNWRINLKDKSVSGSFIIPNEIKAGIYLFRAYTNLMRNGPMEQIYLQRVLIISLSEPTPETLMVPDSGETAAGSESASVQNDYSLKVSTTKSSYAVNEKVQILIDPGFLQLPDKSADLSVSVSADIPLQELIPETDIYACLKREPVHGESADFPCKYGLENKGFILTGRIKHKEDNTVPLANGRILLAITDSIAPQILYTETDANGEFRFYLSSLYDNKDLILQFGDQSRYADYTWEVDQKIITGDQMKTEKVLLQPQSMAFLGTIKDLRLIEAIYTGQKAAANPGSVFRDVNYFSPPDFIVFPGDYAELVNFKEIADNILPEVKLVIRNRDYSLHILNKRTRMWQESNLVLLNGVPYSDLSYIATLGTKDIRRIEVINENLLLGELTLPGLVSIYTHDNSLPENFIRNNTLAYRNIVVPNDPENERPTEIVSEEHDPDFRTTLYWNPHVIITGKETLSIEFPASRFKGHFTVRVRGLAGNAYPVRADTSFEVK